MEKCNKNCKCCKFLSGRTDGHGYVIGYECIKNGEFITDDQFETTKEWAYTRYLQ